MIIVEGKKIAEDLKLKLTARLSDFNKPKMVAVLVGDNSVSANYVKYKLKFGEEIGVEVVVMEYEEAISQVDLEQEISRLANDDSVKGLIVQLPLPTHLESEKILALIPPAKDVDALGPDPVVLSPVVRSVAEIFDRYKVGLDNKKVVVIGNGKLVGRPIAVWLASLGADVVQIKARQTKEVLTNLLQEADVIISGVGKPALITKDMIKSGAILIDAATSEEGGKIAGDIASDCAEGSFLFTPVPGGVGPITLAMLFMNLADLIERKS